MVVATNYFVMLCDNIAVSLLVSKMFKRVAVTLDSGHGRGSQCVVATQI